MKTKFFCILIGVLALITACTAPLVGDSRSKSIAFKEVTSEAISEDRIIKVNATTGVAMADATDVPMGVCRWSAASGATIEYDLLQPGEIYTMVSNDSSIAAFTTVYLGTDGTISATGTYQIGFTIDAFSGQYDTGRVYFDGTLRGAVVSANITDDTIVSADLNETILQYATVSISNAEIKALNATPKELVAAPGAGKLIELVSCTLFLDYGSNVLAEPSAPDDLAIEYDNGTGHQLTTFDTTGFITSSADAIYVVSGGGIAGAASAVTAAANVNKNIVLWNSGGEYTGNAGADTVMTAKVVYRVHTTGL